MSAQAYPLQWPEGWPRTARPESSRFKVTPGLARDCLLEEIRRLGGTLPIISTNQPLRQDGLPYASRRDLDDQGVAVYFTYKKRQMVFACDQWRTLAENMQAIRKTIKALRGIERWGASDMMERAFTGFEALRDQNSGKWWRVLGVAQDAPRATVESAYRAARARAHPDKGGSAEQFNRVQKAWESYLRVVEV